MTWTKLGVESHVPESAVSDVYRTVGGFREEEWGFGNWEHWG